MDELLKSVVERLDRLKAATDTIQPSAGFDNRVMAVVIQRTFVDWRLRLWPVGRYALVASVILVALTTLFAADRASRADELAAVTYGTVEQEW